MNVLELPSSFESKLIHSGCDPSVTVRLVFSQALWPRFIFFSYSSEESYSTTVMFLERSFLWICPWKKSGLNLFCRFLCFFSEQFSLIVFVWASYALINIKWNPPYVFNVLWSEHEMWVCERSDSLHTSFALWCFLWLVWINVPCWLLWSGRKDSSTF